VKAIQVISVCDTRKRTKRLDPGMHRFGPGRQFVQLGRACTIEVTERFEYRYPSTGTDPWWVVVSHHVETLTIVPTRWERFKAFVMRRPIVPRAVALTGHR